MKTISSLFMKSWIASLVFLALSAGCTSVAPTTDLNAGESSYDLQTERRVFQRLQNDPIAAVNNITVDADNGVVTVFGIVDGPQSRFRILNIVRGTLGVQAVVDRMSR